MHFANPHFLWVLLVLPLIAIFQWTWGRQSRARFRFSSLKLFRESDVIRRWDVTDFLILIRVLVLSLLIIAAARPQKGQTREVVWTPVTDILLCLDTSTSMRALDFKPKNRLEAAKDVVQEYVKDRPHDRIGLVVFSALAFTQCPLTLDHGALLEFLEHVEIGMIQEDGTAIGTAIMTSIARLRESEAKTKIIILLTDGRSNRGEIDPITAAKAATPYGIKIYTVGAGVPGGGLIPVQHPFFGERLVRSTDDLDEETLRKIAELTGGLYFRATDLKSLKKIYREIDRLEKTNVRVETFADYQDVYFPWLLAGFLLLGIEVVLSQTVWRRLP